MFGLFKKVLGKTRERIAESTEGKRYDAVDAELFEEILLEADVGYDLVVKLLGNLPKKISRIQAYNSLIDLFVSAQMRPLDEVQHRPFVEMIIGVNGAGKTTTIAKLAFRAKGQGEKVMLAAGDTFRAAAIEQLSRWAAKLDVPIVATRQGHDPSAVVYDAIESAGAKGIDRVFVDTAGRLHTQSNLAQELQKMVRVADKAMPGAPHRKLLVLDATQGASVCNQAEAFDAMVGIDGLIITKLDGTAKGGALFEIVQRLGIPIVYIGTGEQVEDLAPFDPAAYVNTLLDAFFTPA